MQCSRPHSHSAARLLSFFLFFFPAFAVFSRGTASWQGGESKPPPPPTALHPSTETETNEGGTRPGPLTNLAIQRSVDAARGREGASSHDLRVCASRSYKSDSCHLLRLFLMTDLDTAKSLPDDAGHRMRA